MPMGPRCSMNMLWNTDIINTCIVFRQWHIGSNAAFVWSFLAIVALGVFYEYLRGLQKAVDRRIATQLLGTKGKGRIALSSGRSTPEPGSADEGGESARGLLKPTSLGTPIPTHARALRASLYGATVFLSFFLMLVFMTYNAYLILAVVLGAAIGHYIFSTHMDVDVILSGAAGGKGMACH